MTNKVISRKRNQWHLVFFNDLGWTRTIDARKRALIKKGYTTSRHPEM